MNTFDIVQLATQQVANQKKASAIGRIEKAGEHTCIPMQVTANDNYLSFSFAVQSLVNGKAEHLYLPNLLVWKFDGNDEDERDVQKKIVPIMILNIMGASPAELNALSVTDFSAFSAGIVKLFDKYKQAKKQFRLLVHYKTIKGEEQLYTSPYPNHILEGDSPFKMKFNPNLLISGANSSGVNKPQEVKSTPLSDLPF